MCAIGVFCLEVCSYLSVIKELKAGYKSVMSENDIQINLHL